MDFIIYVLTFISVLSVIVFIHEYGHFSVARLFKTKIDVFSIGFGRELFGFNDKHGTRWKVSSIPLGGYVKFFGDRGAASEIDDEAIQSMSVEERRHCFALKPVWQRFLIVFAGPFFNIAFAFLIFFVFAFFNGIISLKPLVGDVKPDSPAATVGLQKGDLILDINAHNIDTATQVFQHVITSSGQNLNIGVLRDRDVLHFDIVPNKINVQTSSGPSSSYQLGIIFDNKPENFIESRFSLIDSAVYSYQNIGFIVSATFSALKQLIFHQENLEQLSGPIRIGYMTGEAAKQGASSLVMLMAGISLSIGIANLFPIPMLDGGHLVFYTYEMIFRKPLPLAIREGLFKIGIFILLSLMIFTVVNDIILLKS